MQFNIFFLFMQIQEDLSLIQRVKSFFSDCYHHHQLHRELQLQSKPALSEHSTSNPTVSSNHSHFQSPLTPYAYATTILTHTPNGGSIDNDDEEETGVEANSDSGDQMNLGLPIRLESGSQKGNSYSYYVIVTHFFIKCYSYQL